MKFRNVRKYGFYEFHSIKEDYISKKIFFFRNDQTIAIELALENHIFSLNFA